MDKFLKYFLNIERSNKIIILISLDLISCIFATWASLSIRLDKFLLISNEILIASLISFVLALPIFWFFGLYKILIRHFNSSAISIILPSILFYSSIYFLIFSIYGMVNIPRSIGILQPILLFFFIISFRLLLKYLLEGSYLVKEIIPLKKTLVYGAGNAGRQLVIALENKKYFEVVGFLDDDERLHGQTLQGKIIYSPLNLDDLINFKNVKTILLAIPSISRSKRISILKTISDKKIQVKTLPSFSDIAQGKVSISDIKELDVEDIIAREQVTPITELLTKNITSKVILITGAGGSIGSELARQVAKLNPQKLLLLELNEFNLFNIYEELKFKNKNLKIIPLLADVKNEIKVNEILKTFGVNTVYHAAAYKHVPLVEENICEGIKNNVFATLSIVKAALFNSIENFVFISSDKAVRPTNIMGVSKRLAELCIQALFYNVKNNKTKIAIVRFGNVLESSGSAISKFKKQIKDGGPVTLTHPDVTRYFMTLAEASQLVIQSGAMSEDCNVFVLDMGESIRIKDLIYRLIKLSGLTVKDENNNDGDIEIKIIGLRPGEKLYEELLLGENPQKTQHPKILKAQDPFIPFDELEVDLNILKKFLDHNKVLEVKELITKIVKTYQSNSSIVDHIYLEQSKSDKKSFVTIDEHKKVVKIKKI